MFFVVKKAFESFVIFVVKKVVVETGFWCYMRNVVRDALMNAKTVVKRANQIMQIQGDEKKGYKA